MINAEQAQEYTYNSYEVILSKINDAILDSAMSEGKDYINMPLHLPTDSVAFIVKYMRTLGYKITMTYDNYVHKLHISWSKDA